MVTLRDFQAAARELAGVVKYLGDWSGLPGDGDIIDQLNAQGHVKALDMVMASLQKHMSTPVRTPAREDGDHG